MKKKSDSYIAINRVRHKLSFIFCLFVAFAESSVAQKIHITGGVQEGFLKRYMPGVVVSLLHSDSTVVSDSLPLLHDTQDNVTRYSVEVPAVKRDYWVRATLDGYKEAWQKISITDLTKKEISVPLIEMRKGREVTLDEMTVKATRVKMYYRGDTLVYDATAFKLPDGSMLDDLIRQLPGTEIRDNGEIFVNGRKIDELLLGSHSFLGGKKSVLMENLPYYTVNKLKVYEKSSDMSIALGREVEPKKFVMDVNLKDEFRVGYIANVEAAGGTEERWLGRGFLLGFTDRWRYTVQANTNNVNESRHIGEMGHWSPDRMPQSLLTTRSVAGEAYYHSKDNKLKNSLSANYTHITGTTDMRQRRETFLEGMTPLSVTESASSQKSYSVRVNEDLTLLKPFYLNVQGCFGREKTDGNSWTAFRQWNEMGEVGETDDALTAAQFTSALDESTTTNAWGRAFARMPINKEKGLDTGFDLWAYHYRNEMERAEQYRVQQAGEASTVSRNANDIYNRINELEAGGFLSGYLGSWGFHTAAHYKLSNTQAHDFLYHPDTLTLPSQVAMLSAVSDPRNSYDYHYTKHRENFSLSISKNDITEFMPGYKLVSERFNITFNIPLLQQKLDYWRGVLDTVATHRTVYINPSARYSQKFGKNERNEIRASASFTTHDLDLLQTMVYRDDSQPLVVRLGNSNLKARQTSTFSIDYANHNGPNKQEISLGTRLDYSHRDIAQSLYYNAETGVYTYQPINISGGYTWSNTLNYSRELDKNHYWTVQSNATATLHHSVDHAMFSGETESAINKVNTLTVGERAYIQYNRDALNVRATGDVKWKRSTGKMHDFATLNVVDYQYGLSTRYTIPVLKTTVMADGTMFSRRGYGSATLNTDDFVLNASLSQPLLKGKLIARLEAFDLLHQLSNTQYEVNAQGRVETWYRSLPHYVMLHLVYHWNANPKKRN